MRLSTIQVMDLIKNKASSMWWELHSNCVKEVAFRVTDHVVYVEISTDEKTSSLRWIIEDGEPVSVNKCTKQYRDMGVIELHRAGYSQTKISNMLEVSQSQVSALINKNRKERFY